MPPTSSWPGTTNLTNDSWVFEAQWSARPGDDPARCAERLLTCLQGMAALHLSLQQWYDANEPIALDTASVNDLVTQEWDEEDPSEGATVVLWNGAKDDASIAEISLGCGSIASYINNGIGVSLPRPAGAPQLYRAETMLALFQTMISHGNHNGAGCSHGACARPPGGRPQTCWPPGSSTSTPTSTSATAPSPTTSTWSTAKARVTCSSWPLPQTRSTSKPSTSYAR